MSELLKDIQQSQPVFDQVFERHGVVLAYLYGSQLRRIKRHYVLQRFRQA